MSDLTPPAPADLTGPTWRERAEAWLAALAADLAPEAAEWAALLAGPAPVVVDAATYEHAKACLRTARDAKNAIDARRKVFTEPLHEVKARVDALFRPIGTAAAGLERGYRDAINAYETRQEAARQAAARAAAEQAPDALAVPPPPERPEGVGVRRVWRFRVTDPAAVPRELCSPDPALIRARGPAQGIPGVEWYEESEVRVR